MEKLQAALARAREKRENDGRPIRRTQPVLPGATRRAASEQRVTENWGLLPTFTPDAKQLRKSHIYAGKATADAQHFDILRTKLLLEMRRNDWSRIAITSATAGCGKTTTSCNLIAGLGRQQELRGMLFDLDLRRPAISKLFGVKPSASLEAVLNEEAEFPENALRLHENTCVSMTNQVVGDPSKLILRSRTAEIFDELQAMYQPDLMLFDMPPILVSDETRGFLKQVDAVLIVAASDVSSIAQIDEVEREIAQYTNVAGIVLNKCRFMEKSYGYSY